LKGYPNMETITRLFKTTYQHFLQDSLRRTSSLLILSNATNTVASFLFWLICARLFDTQAVGLAVSLISFCAVVSSFTTLGLPNTIVRFLPTSQSRGTLFTGALCLLAAFSLSGAIASVVLVSSFITDLGSRHSSLLLSIVLILLIVGNTINSFMDGTLMAFRKGQYVFKKTLVFSVPRVILLPLVVSLGLSGILGTYATVLLLGITYSMFVTIGRLMPSEVFRPSLRELWSHRSFASANYFGGMFAVLSGTLLPIIVLARLGATAAAYFYMPMQIAFAITFIAISTSQALVAEASQTSSTALHKVQFQNAAVHLYRLLIPVALVVSILGWPLLSLYGAPYAKNGYLLLILLCISTVFVATNWLGDTWLNIRQRSRAYFLMNAFNALIVVGAVYSLSSHGLIGVGIGYLLGQLASATVYVGILARSHLVSVTPWLR
jgi:O-antigen/teichoic acid export membrane protein